MKFFPPFILIVCVVILVQSTLMTPLMKLRTGMAMEQIEKEYLRADLTEKQTEGYEFRKKWILWNQEGSHAAYLFSLKGIFLITGLSALQNAILLMKWMRNRKVEPDGAGQRR